MGAGVKHAVIGLLFASLVLTACGGGGSGKQSASDFAVQELTQAAKGQNGKRWESLHPELQKIVSKDKYIQCTQDDSAPLTNIKATDAYAEPVNAPGVGQVDTTAVTVEYKVGSTTDHITMHVLQVDDAWKWFLDQDSYDAFSAGKCP